MNSTIKDLLLGFFVICAISVLGWYVFTLKKPIESELAKADRKADSIAAAKPAIRYAKKVATIDAVTVFELVTYDNEHIFVTISNAPGVSASVTVK